MADTNELAKSIQEPLQELDFKNIIGGPLSACIHAQEEAAQATINYMHEVVFNDLGNDVLEPVPISFIYSTEGGMRKLTMPLIMVVPVPYLQIDVVDFNFQATVTASDKDSLKAKFTPRRNLERNHEKVEEVVAKNHIDISLRARPSAMPDGISKLLNLMQSEMVRISEK